MKNAIRILLVLLFLAANYLWLWPSRLSPEAWTPPFAPSLQNGPYALNDRLKGVQRLAVGAGVGPEGITVDAQGRVYAGYADGRVVRLDGNGAAPVELGRTGGRPLGLAIAPDGSVVIADARKGLLSLDPQGQIKVLSTESIAVAYGFPDDVDVSHDGKYAYFSDASYKFGIADYRLDLLEHGANGRLLRYDFATGQADALLTDLYFANGVTLGPDEAYVLVNETSAYRITRYWLKGEKAGTHDVFADNLPGFPDNLSFNGRDRFWVAIASPRDPRLDALPNQPMLRKIIGRLPSFLQPGPARHAFVLGFDLDGKLVANLQYAGKDAYAPITSVEEFGDWLYFGSLTEPALARLPLNQAIAAAPLPH